MNHSDIAVKAFYLTIKNPLIHILIGYLIARILALSSSIAYVYFIEYKRSKAFVPKGKYDELITKYDNFLVYVYCAIIFLMYQFWEI